jgi:Ca2+-binding EF-hand superfamily protein
MPDGEAPTFGAFIKAHFEVIDKEKSGEVTGEVFWGVVLGWSLGLTDRQRLALKGKFEPDAGKHDEITWGEFVEAGPGLIQGICSAGRANPSKDWCELEPPGGGASFFLNKRTLETQWQPETKVKSKYDSYAPTIEEYLKREFMKADSDGTGTLDTREFFDMLKGLLINLSDMQITQLHSHVDMDSDGAIDWQEFVSRAPKQLQRIYSQEEEDPGNDWCELPASDAGKTFWYNKRTGKSQWKKPQELVLRGPDLKDYLKKEFGRADADGTGELDAAEFLEMLKGMTLLELTEEEVQDLWSKVDADGDGDVEWTEFMLAAPKLLVSICVAKARLANKQGVVNDVEGWVELPAEKGETFWFNKLTGQSRKDKPDELVEHENSFGPDVKEYMMHQFLRADEDGSGELSRDEMEQLMRNMLFGFTDDEVIELYDKIDIDDDGSVEFNEFVLHASRMIADLYSRQNEPSFETDWCELPHGARTFWYNKRSCETRWDKPLEEFYSKDREVDPASYECQSVRQLDIQAAGLQRQGKYLEALDTMDRSLLLRQRFFGTGSREVRDCCRVTGEMCNLLARSYLEQGALRRVYPLLTKAERLCVWHPPGLASVCANFGCYYRRIHKNNLALSYLQQSCELLEDLPGISAQADTHLNLSTVLSLLNRHEEGLSHARAALRLLQQEIFGREQKEAWGTLRSEDQIARIACYAVAHHNIGAEQQYLKMHQESLVSYNKGMAVASQYLGPKHGIAIKLRNAIVAAKRNVHVHNRKAMEEGWRPLRLPPPGLRPSDVRAQQDELAVLEEEPDIKLYLKEQFKKYDMDGSGDMDSHEFFRMLKSLLLNLTSREIRKLHKKIDADKDGSVAWNEFVLAAPRMISDIYKKQKENFDKDWCEIPAAGGKTFWWNKRMAKGQWEKPVDPVKLAARRAKKNMNPGIEGYLTKQFQKADSDGTGELDKGEFVELMKGLLIEMDPTQIDSLYSKIDSDGDGVEWHEFVAVAPDLLKETYAGTKKKEGEIDWVELPAEGGRTYWYNRLNGKSQWTKPKEALLAEQKRQEANMAPGIKEFLQRKFQEADADGSGELSGAEFWNMLKSLPLGLTDGEIAELHSRIDSDRDGDVEWTEFCLEAPRMLRDICSSEGDASKLWCEIPVEITDDGMGALDLDGDGEADEMDEVPTSFWYNKKTGDSRWDRPVELDEGGGAGGGGDDTQLLQAALVQYLQKQLHKVDPDSDGKLSSQQINDVLGKSLVQIDDEMMNAVAPMIAKLKVPVAEGEDDDIPTEEFAAQAPQILADAAAGLGRVSGRAVIGFMGEEWVEIPWLKGPQTSFWFSRMTMGMQKESPAPASPGRDGGKNKQPPGVKEFLALHFRKADVDGSGSLEEEEFDTLMAQLPLGLETDEIVWLRERLDADGDGDVDAQEFALQAPAMLAELAKEQCLKQGGEGSKTFEKAAEATWVELATAGGKKYYYNKLREVSQWPRPALMPTAAAPSILWYIRKLLQRTAAMAAAKKAGKPLAEGAIGNEKLPLDALVSMLGSGECLLNLSAEEVKEFEMRILTYAGPMAKDVGGEDNLPGGAKLIDADRTVDPKCFTRSCAEWVMLVHNYVWEKGGAGDGGGFGGSDPHWCEIPAYGTGGRSFWYDKRTRQSQWEAPPEVNDRQVQSAQLNMPPMMTEYLQRQFKNAEQGWSAADGERKKGARVLLAEVLLEPLKLEREPDVRELLALVDTNSKGEIEWAELPLAGPYVLQRLHADPAIKRGEAKRKIDAKEDPLRDWVELSTAGGKAFWYNKLTVKSQWHPPI